MKRQLLTIIACLAVVAPAAAAGEAATGEEAPVVTLSEALASTRENNITWKSLGELLTQADAGRDIGVAMFLPKVSAEASWLHMGERHTPDMSALTDMGMLLGELVTTVIEEHPGQAVRFEPYMDMISGGEGSDTFSNFVPKTDTISGTFSVIVPVFNGQSISMVQGAYDRYDAALQQVGHAREALLFATAKAYYGMLMLQEMIAVADRSIESAKEHHRSSKIRAELQAATQLEVKRAELEVTRNESQRVELAASLEKAKSSFRYLTGLEGDFRMSDADIEFAEAGILLENWLQKARAQRKDLAAARIEVLVAEHEVDQQLMKYAPSLNLFGSFKLDNAEQQRFDDDPFSWTVGATLSVAIWDGGIRESEIEISRSKLRRAQMAEEDLWRKIETEVESAYQALQDAHAARLLAERQLGVAKSTQELAKASERAGAATNLEVIDANTMVFSSEALFYRSRLQEAIALLDLLAATGDEVLAAGDIGQKKTDQSEGS